MPNASATVSIRSGRSRLLITIDGPAGVGKSTVAQLLARRLQLQYLDTGATYRALAYEALARGLDPRDAARTARLARTLRVSIGQNGAGQPHVRLDGRDVTRQIRTERVTEAAAIIAQFPNVRTALVRLQRRLAAGPATPTVVGARSSAGIVAEGRDTGSVVFPRAAYKFFLTADVRVRAVRRQMELRQLHGHSASRATITRQLRARDSLDLRRRMGPLVKPAGAVVVDTSRATARQVVERMLRHLQRCAGS